MRSRPETVYVALMPRIEAQYAAVLVRERSIDRFFRRGVFRWLLAS